MRGPRISGDANVLFPAELPTSWAVLRPIQRSEEETQMRRTTLTGLRALRLHHLDKHPGRAAASVAMSGQPEARAAARVRRPWFGLAIVAVVMSAAVALVSATVARADPPT